MRLTRITPAVVSIGLACTPFGLTGCSNLSHVNSDVPVSQLQKSPQQWNGLKVTAASASKLLPEIALTAMNMYVWDFDVELPDPQQFLSCQTRYTVNGKTTVIGGIAVGMPVGARRNDPRHHVTIAMYPEGKSWMDAPKIRCVTATEGVASSSVCDNPFRGDVAVAKGGPALEADGSFRLMWGSKKPFKISVNPDIDVTAMLRVEVYKPSRK